MKTVCTEGMCAGCTACIHVCKKDAISIIDSLSQYDAIIDETKCVDCKACYNVCPNNKLTELKNPAFCFQGWAEDETRAGSSSGGAATAIIKGFLSTGGYVCSCVFENGEFGFKIISGTTDDASVFAGSKYVKSNPKSIFLDIKNLLENEKRVLFLGLPCQVSGLKNYVKKQENLYAVDLICHGSPSPHLLEKYLQESGIPLANVEHIAFRNKCNFGLSVNSKRLSPSNVTDSYTALFLASVDYTENCYSCRFATTARCSDVTLGDAWGYEESQLEKGVSLILCQSEKGEELLKLAELNLEDADLEKAARYNHQLRHPSIKHNGRVHFFKALKNGRSFRYASFRAIPKNQVKRCVKFVLSKIRARFNGA